MITIAEHCITDEISLHAIGVMRRKAGHEHLIIPYKTLEFLQLRSVSRPDLLFLSYIFGGARLDHFSHKDPQSRWTVKIKIWPPELDQPKCT